MISHAGSGPVFFGFKNHMHEISFRYAAPQASSPKRWHLLLILIFPLFISEKLLFYYSLSFGLKGCFKLTLPHSLNADGDAHFDIVGQVSESVKHWLRHLKIIGGRVTLISISIIFCGRPAFLIRLPVIKSDLSLSANIVKFSNKSCGADLIFCMV